MIILRNKLFTRGEKEMWEELHKATNGFRRLPKGFENLGARGSIRLERITKGINGWKEGKHNVDPENLKLLAESLGLPKTAENGYRVLNKYSNKELIERYKRIKEIEKDEAWRRVDEAAERISKPSRTVNDINDYNNAMSNLEMIGEREPAREYAVKKFLERQDRAKDLANLKNAAPTSTAQEDKELVDKVKKELRKRGIEYREYKNLPSCGVASAEDSLIAMNPDYVNPAIIAHEGGHIIDYTNGARKAGFRDIREYRIATGEAINPKTNRSENSFRELALENSASARGLSLMRRAGATQEQLRKAKSVMIPAYQSHYHNSIKNITQDFNDLIKL